MNELNWDEIINMVGQDVKFYINGIGEIKANILSAYELANGQKWVSFSPYNKEFSPSFYGSPLGQFNSVYHPTCDRQIRGFYSNEIFNTLFCQ